MSGTGEYPPAESGFYALGDGKAERLKAQRTDLSGFVRFYLEMFFQNSTAGAVNQNLRGARAGVFALSNNCMQRCTFREVHFIRKTSINLFSYKPS